MKADDLGQPGAGAQVLAMNLPIMIYLMKGLKSLNIDIEYFVNEDGFKGATNQIMFFEALVSGQDKGTSHIHDAQIMTKSQAFITLKQNNCQLLF